LKAIGRSNLNMPLEELREITTRPLVQQSGHSYEIGLMRSGIAQHVLRDIPDALMVSDLFGNNDDRPNS
jgi:hypothetical protein